MSYVVKFIQYWNNSFGGNEEVIKSTADIAMTGNIESIQQHPGATVLVKSMNHSLITEDKVTISGTINYNGTFIITVYGPNHFYISHSFEGNESGNGKTWICYREGGLVGKLDNIDVDEERYVADDFFLREPRRAKVSFLVDEWLYNNFFLPKDVSDGEYKDEINIILYYDENGMIIPYDDDTDLSGWVVGATVTGSDSVEYTIDEIEVLIQRISKIMLQIEQDGELIYTGLINKAETGYNLDRITISCVDFLWLIKTFGEQLIKIIEEDRGYGYISSFATVDALLDKIEDLTNIRLLIEHPFNIYIGETESSDIVDISEVNISAPGTGDVYWEGNVNNIGARREEQEIWVFRYFARTVELGGVNNNWRTELVVRYKKFNMNGIQTGTHSYLITLEEGNDYGGIEYYTIEEAIELFENSLTMWTETSGTTLLYIMKDALNKYHLDEVTQTYYSNIIPVYNDTYTYLDLLKTILFLNNITIYVSKTGTITFMQRDFEVPVIVLRIHQRDILKPYLPTPIQKDEDALEAMTKVWYDEETNGQYYVGPDGSFLDTYMKNLYVGIFNKLPLEVKCGIKKVSSRTGDIYSMYLGRNIKMPDKFGNSHIWVVVGFKKSKDNFKYDIHAYMIYTENVIPEI